MTVTEKLRMAAQARRAGRGHHGGGVPHRVGGRLRGGAGGGPRGLRQGGGAGARDPLDVERAAKALEGAKSGAPHPHFLATSDIHLKYKLKKTRAQVLDEAVAAVALARKYVGDVEFSAEDGGRTPVDYLIEVSRAVVAAGAAHGQHPRHRRLWLPEEYGALIGQVARALGPSAIVSVHCHDDLGPGGRQLAGRHAERRAPGRVHDQRHRRARRQLLARGGRDGPEDRADELPYTTGIRTEQLFPASQLLTEIIGVAPSPTRPSSARNAFAHEAGIHQDGYLKERTTYEIIEPKSVGVPESRLVLGKHSGRHALKARCKELGLALDKPQLDEVYARFSALADRKKGITDEEIRALAGRSSIMYPEK